MANRMVEMDGQRTMGDRGYVTVNISDLYAEDLRDWLTCDGEE